MPPKAATDPNRQSMTSKPLSMLVAFIIPTTPAASNPSTTKPRMVSPVEAMSDFLMEKSWELSKVKQLDYKSAGVLGSLMETTTEHSLVSH